MPGEVAVRVRHLGRAPGKLVLGAWEGRVGRVFGEVGQDGEVEGSLPGEVGVDRAAGEPRALGDAVDLGLAEAALGELVPRGGQHLGAVELAHLGPGEPAHRLPFPLNDLVTFRDIS